MKKPELLAPAGSYEKAKIAFLYGADAVYAGTTKLSLRTRTSMEFDDLVETVKLAHSLNKKVYVAMNIYARDNEYDLIKEEAKYLDGLGVDGIIISDGGIVDVVKEYAPNTEIHISTQANVTSLHNAMFWYKNGAKRVILARELSKDEIKYMTDNKPEDLDIEMFVHGAICYSYSGRCYMSDYMAGRSANHGDCAQPCRWAYNIYAEEVNKPGEFMPVEYDERGTYIFSSKDMCLVHDIPSLFDINVDSLKIEGRLKTEFYLANVVHAYRHALDDYEKDPENWNSEKYFVELDKARTRGITDFFFNNKENKDTQDFSGRQYNPDYEFAGIVVDTDEEGITTIEIRNKLSVNDKLEIMLPEVLEPVNMTIDKLYDFETGEEIETVNPGVKEQKVKLVLPVAVKKGFVIRRVK
ncbi:MAG: U32 family peptidase [Clostridia bacterium]|nr:U32 family peptidase [Clostridia bacterium]